MIEKIEKVQKNTIAFSDLADIIEGAPILPFISSRLFRTPILPIFWQMKVLKKIQDPAAEVK